MEVTCTCFTDSVQMNVTTLWIWMNVYCFLSMKKNLQINIEITTITQVGLACVRYTLMTKMYYGWRTFGNATHTELCRVIDPKHIFWFFKYAFIINSKYEKYIFFKTITLKRRKFRWRYFKLLFDHCLLHGNDKYFSFYFLKRRLTKWWLKAY